MVLASKSDDISGCAAEPIRSPGAIQPHGWLVAYDAESLTVSAFSQNCDQLLGLQPGSPTLAGLRSLLVTLLLRSPAARPGSTCPSGPVCIAGRSFDLVSHRAGQYVLMEFELEAEQRGLRAPIYSVVNHFATAVEQAPTIKELLWLAVDETKRLTGYGRCLAYAFDSAGHGDVVAERADAGYDNYLNHRFPGSDIPVQARDLYVLNRIRVIPAGDYVPIPIHFEDALCSPSELDLSFAHLRSVSSVHLEYMRNMGTLASMSISIVVQGRLWGLISCHNILPRILDLQTRVACEHLGRLLSLHIEALQNKIWEKERDQMRGLSLQIISHLSDSDATLRELAEFDTPLLAIARAEGAAVVFDDQCWTAGKVPATEHIMALAAWVDEAGEIFETDHLASTGAPFPHELQNAAGLLAISFSQVHRHLVIWFRPEIVRSIRWAGDAAKQVDAQGRLHPRRSFESWEQITRGRCEPWGALELQAVADLRQALVGIVLDRTQERTMAARRLEHAIVARQLAEQADLTKTHFLAILSHELRTPLASISYAADVLGHPSSTLSKTASIVPMVKRNVALATRLIDDLFDLSAIAAGKLTISAERVDMHQIVRQVVETLAQSAEAKNLAILLSLTADNPHVMADPARMQQVLWNLLRNAIKFTPPHGQIRIETRMCDGGLTIACSDTGIGIAADMLGRIFNAFDQGAVERLKHFGGLGLGLAIAKGIVDGHGGRLEASSKGLNQGSRFEVFLAAQLRSMSAGA
jgi:chemotaxis family two-component system sensor kinase Cph1